MRCIRCLLMLCLAGGVLAGCTHQDVAYYENGRVQTKTTYYNDKFFHVLHGVHTEYFKDGGRMCEGNYKKGQQDGIWTYWFEDGRVKAVGEWRDGKPWSGVCGVPLAGDAGSWAGLMRFEEYRDGVYVGPVVLPLGPETPPPPGFPMFLRGRRNDR